ncbi:MAG: hypothetical protein CMJ94_06980 [Planctomycetes bacterium]|nr:hypothetical protein [Planctomycetota bacterium]
MDLHIRPLDPQVETELELVAQRMRATLIEVLGEEQGAAMYSLEWLRQRVRAHLPGGEYQAAVLLAEQGGEIVGQAIVRSDQDEQGAPLGLMATIYVLPERRRHGVAQALMTEVEAWIRAQGLDRAATNTGKHNLRLIRLCESRGYRIALQTEDMVQLLRELEEAEPQSVHSR